MNRISKAAAMTIAAGATVLSTAGGAVAYDGHRGGNESATADAKSLGNVGFLNGNALQVPINVPIYACGNTFNLIGFFNPSLGNVCIKKTA